MFEFHFHGLEDSDKSFTYSGTTYDFLEVLCRVAEMFNTKIAGLFVAELLREKDKELPFLRVATWEFEYEIGPEEMTTKFDQAIVIKKLV